MRPYDVSNPIVGGQQSRWIMGVVVSSVLRIRTGIPRVLPGFRWKEMEWLEQSEALKTPFQPVGVIHSL